MAHFLKQVIDSYIYVFFCHFLFRKMADIAFHSEAIERLCFACGNIIMKNAHLIEPSLFQNIIEAFPSNITTVENISPRNLCHSCWRAVKHFVRKQSAIFLLLSKSDLFTNFTSLLTEKPPSSQLSGFMKYKYPSFDNS